MKILYFTDKEKEMVTRWGTIEYPKWNKFISQEYFKDFIYVHNINIVFKHK